MTQRVNITEYAAELERERITVTTCRWRVCIGCPTKVETDEIRPRLILSSALKQDDTVETYELNKWIAKHIVELHNAGLKEEVA